MSFQRARHDHQKELRRSQILKEAQRQISRRDYRAVNIARIAASLGVSKGTIFVYFPTKETLFLTIAQSQLEAWFCMAGENMGSISTKSEMVEHLLSSIRKMPLLAKLISLLHGVLEHNVDIAHIRAFKFFLRDQVIDLGALIDERLKWHPGAGARGILHLHTVLIGTYEMAHPSPAVAGSLKSNDLALFRIDMNTQLERLLPLVFRNTKT